MAVASTDNVPHNDGFFTHAAYDVPQEARHNVVGNPLLGISCHGLQSEFLRDVEVAGFTRRANIYDIEERVIRCKGSSTLCPRTGLLGAAYVDAMQSMDSTGTADYMLSYTWGYSVGDIVDALERYCQRRNLDCGRCFVWICCLCINQHRVQEAQRRGEQVSFETFEQEFGGRVSAIRNIIVLMSPWHAPVNLTRVWCAYEINKAITLVEKGCQLEIVMPPHDETNFTDQLFQGVGLERVWKALAGIDVKNAEASSSADRIRILAIINRDFQGYEEFDRKVAMRLQAWFTAAAEEKIIETMGKYSDEGTAIAASAVGQMLQKLGKFDAAEAIMTAVYKRLVDNGRSATRAAGHLLVRLGAVQWRKSKPAAAHTCFVESREILSSSGADQTKEFAALLMEEGIVHLLHKRANAARTNFQEAYRILQLIECLDHADAAELYRCHGQLLRNQNDNEGALVKFMEAGRILDSTGTRWTPDNVVLLTNIGNIHRDSGDLASALCAHKESWAIASDLGILHSLEGAGLLMSMGRVQSLMGAHSEAMTLFSEAYSARVVCGSMDTTGGALLLTYMGFTKECLGHVIAARTHYQEALRIWVANHAGAHNKAQECQRALNRL